MCRLGQVLPNDKAPVPATAKTLTNGSKRVETTGSISANRNVQSSRKTKRIITEEELAEKCTTDECWIAYKGNVYDVTKWLSKHPGGLRSIMSTAGKDATSVMISLHAPETLEKHMRRIRMVGVLSASAKSDEMEKDFHQLHDWFLRNGWYEREMFPYVFVFIRVFCFWACAMCGIYHGATYNNYGSTIVGAVFFGLFFQNLAFVGHDAGHGSVTMSIAADNRLGWIVGNLLSGIDMTWWKSTHYVHHSATNAVEDDPDIQHSPLFCFSTELFESRFSTYHGRFLPSCYAKMIQHQHWYYFPILGVARFNLYIQSFIHLYHTCPFTATTSVATPITDPQTNKDRPKYAWPKAKVHHWIMSVVTLLAFYVGYGTFLLSLPHFHQVVLAVVLSHFVAGILHVQILLSHIAMEYCIHSFSSSQPDESNYYEWQALSTMDIACSPLMDWFHGGLQFQLEHHMFPRLPRWKLRKAIPLIDEVFKKYPNRAQPQRIPFVEANIKVLQHMKRIGQQVMDLHLSKKYA